MKFVHSDFGKLLFEKITTILDKKGLGPAERIPKYRSILEDLFRELTSDELGYVSGLFAQITFITSTYDIEQEIRDFTRFLRLKGNEVTHDSNAAPSAFEDALCLYLLSEIISYFSQEETPKEIISVYQKHQKGFSAALKKRKPRLPTHAFRAVVLNVFSPKGSPHHNFCIITCEAENFGTITLMLNDYKDEKGFGSNLSEISRDLLPFTTIFVTDVRPHHTKPNAFNSTYKTLVVLEPDYLVQANDLSSCVQFNGYNPLIFHLNRLNRGEVSDKMMVGNIVGQILDDMIADKKYSYERSFEKVMRSNSFGMLTMAHQENRYDRRKIKAVFNEAQLQEHTIVRILESQNGKSLLIEPTFISDKFGLQGRLDLLIEDHRDKNRKDIIELKSGRFPKDISLYPNHEAQTLCYDLLIRSTFPSRKGISSILYSRADKMDRPLRNVTGDRYYALQNLLMLRNRIVSDEYRFASGDFTAVTNIPTEQLRIIPRYFESKVKEYVHRIKTIEDVMKAYFFGFSRFIYRELQVAKIGNNEGYENSGGFAALWRATRDEKLQNFNVLLNLEFVKIKAGVVTLKVAKDLFFDGVTNFRKGETALLYPTPDPQILNPLSSQILKCVIISIGKDEIEIRLLHKQLNPEYLKSKTTWALERDFWESSYKNMLRIHYDFLNSEKRFQQLILGYERPQFDEVLEINDDQLNPHQREVVKQAISAKDYFLIQGPPGTGKTSNALCGIVRQLVARGENIVILAFTNRAVNEICLKLQNMAVDFIRLGRGEDSYCWEAMAQKRTLDKLYDKVKATRIFVATQASFCSHFDLLKFKSFHSLIVDEASQLLEPHLTGILQHFKRFILIGDERQLPAVVLQDEENSKCTNKLVRSIGLTNYRESLFSRMLHNATQKGWNDCHAMLVDHYRMHEDIADFPNKVFYESKLIAAKPEQKAPIKVSDFLVDHPLSKVFTQSRVVFIPAKREPRNKVNEQEAELVADLLKYLQIQKGADFDFEKTVGVITPFRAQIAMIKSKLPEDLKPVMGDTVERFQGSEREIIIISFAVKSQIQLRSIQSLNEDGVDRKLNVAITRAQSHLILIGCEEVLERSVVFDKLIGFVKGKGGYLERGL